MEEIARRLSEALDRKDWSRRELQRQIEGSAPDLTGNSLPSVLNYLEGKHTPSVEFLRVVADLLGVRVEWLAFGSGEPTEEAEAAERAREGGPGLYLPVTEKVHGAFEEEFPPFARLNKMHQWAIWDLWTFVGNPYTEEELDEGRHAAEAAGKEWDPDQPFVEAARNVGGALAAPAKALGLELSDVDNLELHRYVELACQAFLFLVDQDKLRWSYAAGVGRRVEPDPTQESSRG